MWIFIKTFVYQFPDVSAPVPGTVPPRPSVVTVNVSQTQTHRHVILMRAAQTVGIESFSLIYNFLLEFKF